MPPILPQEYDSVKNNLDLYPIFTQILTEKWITNNILNPEDRLHKHYLFWELINKYKTNRLANQLDLIKNNPSMLSAIISKIKQSNKADSFNSFNTELIVLAHYKSMENKNFKVEYEPSVPNMTTKNDILLKINNVPYYVEIFTLTDDNFDRRYALIKEKITEKIESIENNPFIISFMLYSSFEEIHIEEFSNTIITKIEEFKTLAEDNFEIVFEKNNLKLADSQFVRNTRTEQGYVSSTMTDVRIIENDARIKKNILTKTEQVSSSTNNILVANLLTLSSDVDDFTDALFGELALSLNRETGESKVIRSRNGAIIDDRCKKFSCFICFVRNDYHNRKKYGNGDALHLLNNNIFSLL